MKSEQEELRALYFVLGRPDQRNRDSISGLRLNAKNQVLSTKYVL